MYEYLLPGLCLLIFYLLFCSRFVCIAVLHTLVRNRNIGPAHSEPKGLPSATPVGHHIINTPTYIKLLIMPLFHI